MPVSETFKLTIICFTLSLACNFQYGFSATYLNTPVDEFKHYLNISLEKRGIAMTESLYTWIWNLIANIWFIGFFCGIWLGPILNDKYGRKFGFVVFNGTNLIASLLRFLAILFYLPELLIIGRFIASISTAITYQSLIMYLQECSPTRLRGAMSFTSEISFGAVSLIGMFLGMDFVFGKDLRYLVGFAIIPCIIAFIVLIPMPETPKFLFIVKKDKEAATKSIKFYHGKSANISTVLHQISLEAEKDSESNSSVREILTTPYLRKALILSCLALQNTLALSSLLLLSTDLLKHNNLDSRIAQWFSVGMTAAYAIGTVLGSPFVERYGRRPMLLFFSTANIIILLFYVIFAAMETHISFLKYGCLLCFVIYGFNYGFGVGSIAWFLSSELVPQRHRSLMQSFTSAINTVILIILTFTILPLFSLIKAYVFLVLYIIPSSCGIIILYAYLPETKGREIYQIVAELKGKKSQRIDAEEKENIETEENEMN